MFLKHSCSQTVTPRLDEPSSGLVRNGSFPQGSPGKPSPVKGEEDSQSDCKTSFGENTPLVMSTRASMAVSDISDDSGSIPTQVQVAAYDAADESSSLDGEPKKSVVIRRLIRVPAPPAWGCKSIEEVFDTMCEFGIELDTSIAHVLESHGVFHAECEEDYMRVFKSVVVHHRWRGELNREIGDYVASTGAVDSEVLVQRYCTGNDMLVPHNDHFHNKAMKRACDEYVASSRDIFEQMRFASTFMDNLEKARPVIEYLPVDLLVTEAFEQYPKLIAHYNSREGVLGRVTVQRFMFADARWKPWLIQAFRSIPYIQAHAMAMYAVMGWYKEFDQMWVGLLSRGLEMYVRTAFKAIRVLYMCKDIHMMSLTELRMYTRSYRLTALGLWYRTCRIPSLRDRSELVDQPVLQGQFGRFAWRAIFGAKQPRNRHEAAAMYPPERPFMALRWGNWRFGTPPVGASFIEKEMFAWRSTDIVFGEQLSRMMGGPKCTNANVIANLTASLSLVAEVIQLMCEGKVARGLRMFFSLMWLKCSNKDLPGMIADNFLKAWAGYKGVPEFTRTGDWTPADFKRAMKDPDHRFAPGINRDNEDDDEDIDAIPMSDSALERVAIWTDYSWCLRRYPNARYVDMDVDELSEEYDKCLRKWHTSDPVSFVAAYKAAQDAKRRRNGQINVPGSMPSLESQPEVLQNWTSLMKSELGTKFFGLIAVMSVPTTLAMAPGFMKDAIGWTSKNLTKFAGLENVGVSLWGFVVAFFGRCREFCQTWDITCFLREAGLDSYVSRCHELLNSSVKERAGNYHLVDDQMAVAEKLIAEGNKYRTADKTKTYKLFNSAHEIAYKCVYEAYGAWKAVVSSAAERARAPFSVVLLGPPGTAKTTTASVLARHVVFRERGDQPEATAAMSATDMYTVPTFDKHWNNCVNPLLLMWNDLPGDGYDRNGFNVPDMLRRCVDIEPLSTPQADLTSKSWNCIDPKVNFITSNAERWDFRMFGSDWSKLLRRYDTVYKVDYPDDCYGEAVGPDGMFHRRLLNPEIKVNAELAPRMRIYRYHMRHVAGRIHFDPGEQVGTGLDELEIMLKRGYDEHMAKVPYAPGAVERCNMRTAMTWHENNVGPCCLGCEFVGPMLPPGFVHPARLQCSGSSALPVVQGVVNAAVANSMSGVNATVEQAAGAIVLRATQTMAQSEDVMVEVQRTTVSVRKWSEVLAAVGTAALVLIVSAALVRDVVHFSTRKTKPKVETVQAVKNPTDHDFELSMVGRYGLEEAKKRELPNPPTYPTNYRGQVMFSAASATTSVADLRALVRKNTVRLTTNCNSKWAYGLFITPSVLMLNHHCARELGFESTWLIGEGGVSHKLEFKPQMKMEMQSRDLCFVRTPAFCASDLRKHFAESLGQRFDVYFGDSETLEEAQRMENVDCTRLGMGTIDVVAYNRSTAAGDCGKPVVAVINNRPMVLGIHFGANAKLTHGHALVVLRKTIDLAHQSLCGSDFVVNSMQVSQPYTALAPLASNSIMRTEATGVSFEVAGSTGKVQSQSKSQVVVTRLHAIAEAELSEPRVIPALQSKGLHVAGEWNSPMVHKLKGMMDRSRSPCAQLMYLAVEDYLYAMPVAPLAPLNLHQAIAGVEGDPLLKHINLTTASGIYRRFYGQKTNIVNLTEINAEMKAHLARYIANLEEGVVVERQTWALKDEVVTAKKEAIRKYRYFMVSDFHNLLAFRMFVAPLVAHMYRNKEFFEAYGAFNPASLQFEELCARLRVNPHLLLADMKHMDSSHKANMAEAIANIFVRLGRACGYNEKALKVVFHLVHGVVYSLVEVNGDVTLFTEGMGSGVYVTFIFNCLAICLLYRCAWYKLCPGKGVFRASNVLVAGGDDSAASTSEANFTQPAIAEVFFDYGYTLSPPTDKSGKLKDFYEWSELVFLKRERSELVYQGKVYYAGKLDPDSVWKSLGFWLKDGDISERDRMEQALDCAQREFALHGEEKLKWFQDRVRGVYSYQEKSYEHIIGKYIVGKLYEGVTDASTLGGLLEIEPSTFNSSNEMVTALLHEESIKERFSGEPQSGSGLFNLVLQSSTPVEQPSGVRSNGSNNPAPNAIFEPMQDSMQQRTVNFSMVSDVLENTSPTHYPAEYMGANEEVSIKEYLSRPVDFGRYAWTASTSGINNYGAMFGSWKINSQVASKLKGYHWWRARPKLRMVVNGQSFYYGKLLIVFQPEAGEFGYRRRSFLANGPKNAAHCMQMPHVAIDPSVSATYDIELPWYSARDWCGVLTENGASVDPDILVWTYPLIGLSSANGTQPMAVDVKFYIIMNDVELSVPGNAEALPVLFQSSVGKEAKKGPVAKMTAKMAVAAGAAAAVPALAPYAGPLAAGFAATSKAAQLLGYGKPIHLEDTQMSFAPIENTSVMDGRSHAVKLAADELAEVAPAASAAGIGSDDDMMLSNIMKKPGLLSIVQWASGSNVGSMLYETPVKPSPSPIIDPLDPNQLVQHTPLSWIAFLFHYWTGTIIYDIEIVCSGYHRGALAVTWDPNVSGSQDADFITTQQTVVMDVSQTRKISFPVAWGNRWPWAPVLAGNGNGLMRLIVQTPITSPAESGDIYIIVTCRAGDDFDVSKVDMTATTNINYLPTVFQSGPEIFQSGEGTGEVEIEEVVDTVVPAMVAPSAYSGRSAIYFGEKYTSIKQLMNRYSVVKVFQETVAGTFQWRATYLPPVPDWNIFNDGVLPTGRMTLQAYFLPAFLAMRGGIRYKVLRPPSTSTSTGTGVNMLAIMRYQQSTQRQNWSTALNDQMDYAALLMENFGNGGVITLNEIKAGIEFEVPYTQMFRFVDPRISTQLQFSSTATGSIEFLYNTGPSPGPMVYMQAVGDDFSLHGFYAIPPTYAKTP